MLDIVHFRDLHDAYGHQCGDEFLLLIERQHG
ncbi:diguanylate cyclase domain-containing protein [Sphaerochaeta halotolerans]|nr:diguanylate cyclase [Spirochaetaceae bacterium]MXI85890.1 diguanylate cyclase [Sphaerochaeta halotolerans]